MAKNLEEHTESGFAAAVSSLAGVHVEVDHEQGLAHVAAGKTLQGCTFALGNAHAGLRSSSGAVARAGMTEHEAAGMSTGFLKAVGVQRAVESIHAKLAEHAELKAATAGRGLAVAEQMWNEERASWERALSETEDELKHSRAEVLRLQVVAEKRCARPMRPSCCNKSLETTVADCIRGRLAVLI